MSIKKTLGGDRLGSGNRMKQEMHNFFRSNHNLSCTRASSMAAGVLYPMYTNIGLKGDTFDMDLSAFVRTIPTEGPLFGSFKLQADVFQVPFRLYQAILHNNTTEIGMEMNQVLLPKIKLTTTAEWNENTKTYNQQISRSSLLNYLGISGIARPMGSIGSVSRNFNAIPMLAYYDIFKNYYANKQEENAYVIGKKQTTYDNVPNKINVKLDSEQWNLYIRKDTTDQIWNTRRIDEIAEGTEFTISLKPNRRATDVMVNYAIVPMEDDNYEVFEKTLASFMTNSFVTNKSIEIDDEGNTIYKFSTSNIYSLSFEGNLTANGYAPGISLLPFKLEYIDKMRKHLLTKWDLGEEVVFQNNNGLINNLTINTTLPYAINWVNENNYLVSNQPMTGLVVKTYQSDMFNNWLDTEWVDRITELSSVSTASGSFTIDSLNFARKVYDHYNRIAISGGTYDDWQEATYGDKVWGKTEKPIYCGGFSAEVVFDEVVSTAATDIDANKSPLGTLGGRGSLTGNRGGHVVIKVNEASVIMVMVSLTPRVCYTQGNAWYMTDLDSIDDLHKPMFDRIGFQDLLGESMTWENAKYISTNQVLERPSVGKQPAWIHYMTDINKAYGDFAEPMGKGFMVLKREYTQNSITEPIDFTTYIDPAKFNYAFAYTELEAQNFWTFLKLDIKARRKMSATQIPNL